MWQQRSSYSHPDLHDEVVLDVDGPFGSVGGVDLIRLLVCGDRNSGKSSLLHALSTHSGDRDWLLVNSLLPSIGGSFVNARFGQSGDFVPGCAPVDEPPYLDTDVARGTVVLTREDFAFFVADFGLKDNFVISGDYVALELTEIGGDHLAEMMKEEDAWTTRRRPPLLSVALSNSLDVIRNTSHIAYFVNCSTLHPGKLLERLRWIRGQTSAEITVFASRLPEKESEDIAVARKIDADEMVSDHRSLTVSDDGDDDRRSVLEASKRDDLGTPLTRTLFGFLTANSLRVDQVRPARHILPPSYQTETARVDVPGLFSILLALFDKRQPATCSPYLLVAEEVFACAEYAATTTVSDFFDPWIDSERFAAWIEEDGCCGNFSGEFPPQLALPHFDSAARYLCDSNLLIRHHDAGHADVVFEAPGLSLPAFKRLENCQEVVINVVNHAEDVLFFDGTKPAASPSTSQSRSTKVRAPLFPRLRHLFAKLVRHRIRLRNGDLSSTKLPEALIGELRSVADKLDEALVGVFAARQRRSQQTDILQKDSSEVAVSSLLWLAEDRMQIAKLLDLEKDDENLCISLETPHGMFKVRKMTAAN